VHRNIPTKFAWLKTAEQDASAVEPADTSVAAIDEGAVPRNACGLRGAPR